jgi:hypothetical protein
MKKEEFKQKLQHLNLTQEKFAKLFELGYSTVKGWKTTPIWVEYVLEYLELSSNLSSIESLQVELQSSKSRREELIIKVRNIDLENKKKSKIKKSAIK